MIRKKLYLLAKEKREDRDSPVIVLMIKSGLKDEPSNKQRNEILGCA